VFANLLIKPLILFLNLLGIMKTLLFISLFISASYASMCSNSLRQAQNWKTSTNDAILKDAALKLFRLHKQERRNANNDIKFTCLSKNLTRISEEHSIFQIKAGFSGRNVPCSKFVQRCQSTQYRSGCGENLAGKRPALEPVNWMTNWMNSGENRPAIVNGKTDTMGIGIVQDPDTKKYWTTVLYVRGVETSETDPNDCINK
jgi:uncharacterized protein YkwD